MKSNAGLKYIFYIALFLIFIIYRINLILDSGGIAEIEYRTLSIASSTFPFGIIRHATLNDYFMPAYYLLIHFFVTIFKSEILIRIINAVISFFVVVYVINIGKKLINRNFGIFLGLFLSLNHFFLYYTNLIAPYCLNFLVITITINYIIDFLKKPNKENLKKLNISNCTLILVDSLGIFFVITELSAFYILFSKKKFFKKAIMPLIFYGFISFLVAFIVLIVHYFSKLNLLIPENYQSIGFNLNGLYLTINEFLTPYLSFNTDSSQTKTTLGMLYSFFLNPKLNNINSFKILITLFYSSILPIFLMVFFTVKSYLKNYKLKTLIIIGLLNLALFLGFVILEYAEFEPIYLISFYIIELFAMFYGIFIVKDKFIRIILLFCLIAIQVINPNINSFNVSIYKNYPVGGFEAFKKDFSITSDDFIIMPYMSKYAKMRYKNLSFFDFDYSMLKEGKRNLFVKNLINKKMRSISKNNALFAYENYLNEVRANDFIVRYFIDNCVAKAENSKSIILVIEKLNSKPISKNSIYKVLNSDDYTSHPATIKFKHANLKQNQSAMLYNALKSKFLYDLISLLQENYYLSKVVEYENVNGEFVKLEHASSGISQAISSYDSDYVFLIFRKI